MNAKVAVRNCREYDLHSVYNLISDIYKTCEGPEIKNKKILVKPNILIDSNPDKCISTHPVVVEAMVRFLQSNGAVVFVGDSPANQISGFRAEKSGILKVCEKTGASWVDFLKNPSEIKLPGGRIRIASVINEIDLIISLPKLKNHELVFFTGAIKNTFGLIPGFSKAKQHAFHHDRSSFSSFLVDLNEVVTPHFFLMDGIIGMDGQGPANGTPVKTGVLIGSTNPLALDIIASSIAGYDPLKIPTSLISLSRGKWLRSEHDIIYNGPEIESIIKKDFKRNPVTDDANIALKFVMNRLKSLRRLQRRPVFIHNKCTGCRECVKICPRNAIVMHHSKKNWVVQTDKNCIRCFCCSEVCQSHAVEIRRKLFGA
ncbi:MAG: DUF362 domain-containing protein [Bacteroidales bacterium]|nr:DUF362 domain-containing protein [Bacteroidales bacterium]